ncbi:hypothetical protein BN971_03250 [Mycobacterium bohemicum DSM 44277]|uniref:Uncharacterized protein n=1 Tax=Mycobacterium bohemicum DSM 44277 TaxID=1236609 RepID=A0A0U0WAU7_MYCBE|nr:hypothetical protein BN971_03250 [Mycobacterium bohemicum DSM 44277]
MTLYAQTADDGKLTVGPEKANGAAIANATKFAITAVQHFDPTDDHDGTVPRLAYAGDSDQTAREHLAENYAAEHDSAKGDAIGWLATYLAAGPRWAADAHTARDKAGFSEKAIKTAKRKLGVESERDTANGPWFWRLPQHQGVPEGRPQVPEDPSRAAWTSGTCGTTRKLPANTVRLGLASSVTNHTSAPRLYARRLRAGPRQHGPRRHTRDHGPTPAPLPGGARRPLPGVDPRRLWPLRRLPARASEAPRPRPAKPDRPRLRARASPTPRTVGTAHRHRHRRLRTPRVRPDHHPRTALGPGSQPRPQLPWTRTPGL